MLLAGCLVLLGCRKEKSFEVGTNPSAGTLQSEITGDCLPKSVNGIYEAGVSLVPATNTISIDVDVTAPGSYLIYTDTVNGFFFRGTGLFTTTGQNTVELRGNGTAFAAGGNNFVVNYGTSVCDIQVTVLPAGSTSPAVFTLVGTGTPVACGTPVITGTYIKDVALSPNSNTVTLNVNTTTAGLYNVSTTAANGMTFTGTGSLTAGPGTVLLKGSGIPTATGPTNISVTAGASTCSFSINVVAPVTGTLGGATGPCAPITVNGSYTKDVPLTSTNTIQVQITTTAAGAYSVTTTTVAGMSFNGSGTAVAGAQNIILTGTGTPSASGPQNFTVTFGTSTCTFSIPVTAGVEFTVDCSSAFADGDYIEGEALDATNTVEVDVTVVTPGAYNIVTTAVNGMVFSASGTFAAAGPATITLTGSGTPSADGTFAISLPGTTPCTFDVDVEPGVTIDWQFTASGPTTIFSGSIDLAQMATAAPPILSLTYFGSNTADDILFTLTDMNGGIQPGETYSSSLVAGTNVAGFLYSINSGADNLTTDATRNITFTITTHNTASKIITGTFSGSVKNSAGTTRTITAGTFTADYN